MANNDDLIDVPDITVAPRPLTALRATGRWLLSHFAAVAALLISVAALLAALQANHIAKQAKAQAARTYLSIEPEAIPTTEPPLAEVMSQFGAGINGERYLLVLGSDKKLFTIVWVTVRNSGTNEARDVRLEASVEFLLPPGRTERLSPITAQFTLGDLAPGQARSQDILADMTFDNIGSTTTRTFQKLFEEDVIRGKLTLRTTYVTQEGERVESGRYVGTTSRGGTRLGIQTELKSAIAKFVQQQSSSAPAK